MNTEERLAALEKSVADLRSKLGLDEVKPGGLPAGWEDIPPQLVAIGFSRENWLLRPAKYANEPMADRLVSRGSLSPTSYVYDESLPAWKNYHKWQEAGAPTRDANGVVLDVAGHPIEKEGKWVPEP